MKAFMARKSTAKPNENKNRFKIKHYLKFKISFIEFDFSRSHNNKCISTLYFYFNSVNGYYKNLIYIFQFEIIMTVLILMSEKNR